MKTIRRTLNAVTGDLMPSRKRSLLVTGFLIGLLPILTCLATAQASAQTVDTGPFGRSARLSGDILTVKSATPAARRKLGGDHHRPDRRSGCRSGKSLREQCRGSLHF